MLAGIVFKKNPGNKADLKNPEIAVIVEIIKSWCFLAVAPDYFKYKKYNLFELCNDNKDKAEVGSDAAKEDQDQDKKADEVISNQKPKDETSRNDNNEKVEDQGQAKEADEEIVKEDPQD